MSLFAPQRISLRRGPAPSRWRRWSRLPERAIETATDATVWAEARTIASAYRLLRRVALAVIPLFVAAVAYLDRVSGHLVDAGVFYHLPIILCCALLGWRGLLMIPVCLTLYHGNEILTAPAGWPHTYGNDLAKVVSWSLTSSLALFTRRLHLSLAEKSRELAAKQRLAEEEMALAEQVQRCLFNIPSGGYRDDHVAIYAHSTSLSRVGGDFCRLVLQGDEIGLMVGDVVGKGVPAALVMTMCVTALTGDARRLGQPAQDLQRCNEVLYDNFTGDQAMTATACVGRFDRVTSEFVFSLAGHEPPLLLAGGAGSPWWQPGMLMGAAARPDYPLYRVALRPGDRLVLCTDGATEARSPSGEEFGRERLEASARRCAHLPADEMLRGMLAEIHAHAGAAGLRDDLTLVVLERL